MCVCLVRAVVSCLTAWGSGGGGLGWKVKARADGSPGAFPGCLGAMTPRANTLSGDV